jgi:hypothetical protein
MLPECWVPQRQMFVFRCESAKQSHWAFCVDQQTLEELDDDAYYDRTGIFDAFRRRIYQVACDRMVAGDPAEQHRITAEEIRGAFLPRDAAWELR